MVNINAVEQKVKGNIQKTKGTIQQKTSDPTDIGKQMKGGISKVKGSINNTVADIKLRNDTHQINNSKEKTRTIDDETI